ncbi:MAG: hypothetical protein LC650_04430, partial [Actinobacteria bacterium]|nr:hypothetical protein [Actinomycetota bacterium]
YITFHPNTIVYAVKKESEVGQDILDSEIGIVWHTRYKGNSIESMSSSFDIYEKDLPNIDGLWSTSVHGEGTMADSVADNTELISAFETLEARAITTHSALEAVDPAYQKLLDHRSRAIPLQIAAMVNQYVKDGNLENMPTKNGDQAFLDYLTQKYEKRKEGKDEKKQGALDRELGRILAILDEPEGAEMREGIRRVMQLQVLLHQMKMIVMKGLEEVSSHGGVIRTYLLKKESDGVELKPAGPEGFVVTTSQGIPLKFIDREQFSRANFSDDYVKGWEH